MPAQHDQAHGQRCCEHKPDGSPQRRPEGRRDDDSHGRKASGAAVQQRFDDLPDQRFDDEKQRRCPGQHPPARIDRHGQRKRKRCSYDRADVGHKAQHGRENAPQRRAGNPDQPQAAANQHAEARVEHELIEEKPAQARRGVVERRGRALQIVGARQPDQTVPEILALNQDEDHEDDDDPRRCQRRYERSDQRAQALQRAGIGLQHLHRDRPDAGLRSRAGGQRISRCDRLGLVQLLAEILEHLGGTLERGTAARHAAHRLDLGQDGCLVLRQVAGQAVELRRDDAPESENDHEGEQHDADHGQRARGVKTLHQPDGSREDEAQQNRQCDGNEDFSP